MLRYTLAFDMIRSFRHKGVEWFFKTGSKAGIQTSHVRRLNEQLTVLNVATRPEQMNVPGWQWHRLTGKLREHWAVSVNGNWRLTFTFDGEDAASSTIRIIIEEGDNACACITPRTPEKSSRTISRGGPSLRSLRTSV